MQGELQVRGAGEVPCQPGGHHAATCRGVLEVKTTRIPQKGLFFTALSVNHTENLPQKTARNQAAEQA